MSETSARKLQRPPDHKVVTRRDFLGQGLIAGAAFAAGPSLLGLLGSSPAAAQAAADCGIATGGAGLIPFIAVDLGGGANTSGSNVLVGGPGGQLDFLDPEGYEKQGLPSGMFPTDPAQVNNELGLLFHADSPFLRGIQSKTAASTRANVNGVVFAARSANDTGNNPHNPMFGINKAGASGDLVSLIGSRSSDSGGRSQSPLSMYDPAKRPTKVSDENDARGLVDTGKLVELLDEDAAVSVMSTIEQLSDLRVQRMTEDQMVKDLISCSYTQSADLVNRYGDPSLLDPTADLDIVGAGNSIFTANELNSSKNIKAAAAMKLTVNGFAGCSTIESGGYDYHDGSRATGEVRDFEAGVQMGAMLEYAARRSQPLVIYVFSDGSVSSSNDIDNSGQGRGKFGWQSDNGGTASTFLLVYDPNGRPQLRDPNSQQIGYYRPSGSVETGAVRIASNVDLLAEAVVLNYMALHDDLGRFDQVLPSHGLGSGGDRDALIGLQPIRSMG
ncbi:MAG: twin-arginine translocation signal domain-containing protein [bacterium]|nr:twin-arginine translocation signal domain-containing protein [bacterium]